MANGHGGKRPGAGRKPKEFSDELKAALATMEADAHKALHQQIKEGNSASIKMYFEYMYGKPKERIEHSGELDVHTFSGFNFGDDEE